MKKQLLKRIIATQQDAIEFWSRNAHEWKEMREVAHALCKDRDVEIERLDAENSALREANSEMAERLNAEIERLLANDKHNKRAFDISEKRLVEANDKIELLETFALPKTTGFTRLESIEADNFLTHLRKLKDSYDGNYALTYKELAQMISLLNFATRGF